MISKLNSNRSGIALVLMAAALLFSAPGCKSKQEKAAPPPATEEAKAASSDVAIAPVKLKKPKAPPVRESASEEERALVKGFMADFTRVIESKKSDGWLDLHSKARKAKHIEKDAVERSYAAWVNASFTNLAAIRSAEFRLEKIANNRLLLTLEGIKVPNDPEATYAIHLVVEDGALRIDEN